MMKRLIPWVIAISLIFTGCCLPATPQTTPTDNTSILTTTAENELSMVTEVTTMETEVLWTTETTTDKMSDFDLDFSMLRGSFSAEDAESTISQELERSFDQELWSVKEVRVTYLSKEYIEESIYNSLENEYFGYSLTELDELFVDTEYVFTVDDAGNTVAVEFEQYNNSVLLNEYDEVISDAIFAMFDIEIDGEVVRVLAVATAEGVITAMADHITGLDKGKIVKNVVAAFLKALI